MNDKKKETKTEIERIELVTENIMYLKGTDRVVIVHTFSDIEEGKPVAWQFFTGYREPINGPKGESLILPIQVNKKIEDAKDFERAFERFEKFAEDTRIQKLKEAAAAIAHQKFMGNKIILPGQNNLPNPNDPFDLRGDNDPFKKGGG